MANRTGTDVVQIYFAEPQNAHEPPSQLEGFEKVQSIPGEAKTVSVEILASSLAIWDGAIHNWRFCNGVHDFKVGEFSRTILCILKWGWVTSTVTAYIGNQYGNLS